jgi:hypothetical protein
VKQVEESECGKLVGEPMAKRRSLAYNHVNLTYLIMAFIFAEAGKDCGVTLPNLLPDGSLRASQFESIDK